MDQLYCPRVRPTTPGIGRFADQWGPDRVCQRSGGIYNRQAPHASAILASSHLGFALSTTQVASGSVIGSGLGRKGAAVRWNTAGRIGIGWPLTLPAAGGVGALAARVANLGVAGIIIDAVAGILIILAMYAVSQRSTAGHDNAISDVDQAGEAVKIKRKRKKKKDQLEAGQ